MQNESHTMYLNPAKTLWAHSEFQLSSQYSKTRSKETPSVLIRANKMIALHGFFSKPYH